ncbi:MAG: hypothetical protein AAGA99_17100 [Actinomycetota bacterium]
MHRRVALAAVAWVAGLIGFRVALTPPELCEVPSATEIAFAADEAADWAVRGLGDDGRFTYGYRVDDGGVNQSYNLVRHAGMTNALYQHALWRDSDALEAADRSLDALLDLLIARDDWVAVEEPNGDAKLGTVGLLIPALLHRRDLTGDEQYDEEAIALGRFIVAQQESSGAILNRWDPDLDGPVPGVYGRFATGEAFWALAMLDRRFPDAGFREPTLLTADYLALERDEAEGEFLRNPDHWAAYGFAEMARPGGPGLEQHHVDYVRALSGAFGVMARYESQRSGTGLTLLLRGNTALGAGVGAMGEGIAGLWNTSLLVADLEGRSDRLADRLLCTADLLVERQIDEDEASTSPIPDLARGAWFSGGYTQVDDQQHTLSALLFAEDALRWKESR